MTAVVEPALPIDVAPQPSGRVQRKRKGRIQQYLDAAMAIVAAEGFAALTMGRLADDLDTATSAVYRYFPSKGALVTEMQAEALERLTVSMQAISDTGTVRSESLGFDDQQRDLAQLVLLGRWLCAATVRYPSETRLLQMIMSEQASSLAPGSGVEIFPKAMLLIALAATRIGAAQDSGVIRPGNALDRALIWGSGVSGVLLTDDLATYAPEIFGEARLARQANLDLLAGWGADLEALEWATGVIDELEADESLAP